MRLTNRGVAVICLLIVVLAVWLCSLSSARCIESDTGRNLCTKGNTSDVRPGSP